MIYSSSRVDYSFVLAKFFHINLLLAVTTLWSLTERGLYIQKTYEYHDNWEKMAQMSTWFL